MVQSRRLGEFVVPARQCRRNQHGGEPDGGIIRHDRARAGVLLAPPLLLYGTGGFALGQVHENLRVPVVAIAGLPPPPAGGFSYVCTIGTSCFAGAASQTLIGWSAGAGAEYAITSSLIFRTELLYVHLGAPTVTATATAAAAGTAPAAIAAGFSPVYFAVVRGGLNYKF